MRRPQRNTIIRGRRRSRGTSHYRGEEQAESCEVGEFTPREQERIRGLESSSCPQTQWWEGASAGVRGGGAVRSKLPPPMMRANSKRKKSLNVGSGGKRRERTTRPPTSSPRLAREGGDLGKF